MSYIVIFFSVILFCDVIIVIFVIICVYFSLLVALFYKFFQFLQGSPTVDQLFCHLHTCFNGSCFACNIKCGTSIQANCMAFRTCLSAFQNCFCDFGVLLWSSSLKLLFCAALITKLLRSEYIGCKFAIFDLAYRSRCTHGNFIQTVLSEDNHSSCYSKICHDLRKRLNKGFIIKVREADGTKRYDFQYTDRYGYTNTIGGISRLFNEEFWNYAKLISGVLRHGMPIEKTVSLIESLHLDSESINTWKTGVCRALKQYIVDGTKSKGKCPSCGQENMAYQNGCLTCMSCGYSKCG